MSKLDIYLLDNMNKLKGEISMIKPNTYRELKGIINKKLKNIQNNKEIFILDTNYNEIKINNDIKYKSIDDILFIREIDKNIIRKSIFETNIKVLTESCLDKIDDMINCNICTELIKNENPYFCYGCQKIFHEKCLKGWVEKCKSQNTVFSCPNCRNQLSIEQWKKKLKFEENRKYSGKLLNKIIEFEMKINMSNIIIMIKNKKINELKEKKKNQFEFMKKYKIFTIELFQKIGNKINSINSLLKFKNNNKLQNLFGTDIKNIEKTKIDDISNEIEEELEHFKNYMINNDKSNQQNKAIQNQNLLKENNNIKKEKEINNNYINKAHNPSDINQIDSNQKPQEISIISSINTVPKKDNLNDISSELTSSTVNNIINMSNLPKTFGSNEINNFEQTSNIITQPLTETQIKKIVDMTDLPKTFGSSNINKIENGDITDIYNNENNDSKNSFINLGSNENIDLTLTPEEIKRIIEMKDLPETFGTTNMNNLKNNKISEITTSFRFDIDQEQSKITKNDLSDNNQIASKVDNNPENIKIIHYEDYFNYTKNKDSQINISNDNNSNLDYNLNSQYQKIINDENINDANQFNFYDDLAENFMINKSKS